jgi:predicted DNA-binding transcriptional regulator YafY
MNRIDRLFAILLVLQDRRKVRAQDLARKFEVSERTIYRDMLALSEGGVPIAAIPNVGYELLEGFSLPPLLFNKDEAQALFLAGKLFVASADGRLPDAAKSALAKVRVVLPTPLRDELTQLAGGLHFSRPAQRFDLDEPRLNELSRAVRERRVVWLRYHALNTNDVAEREIEPLGLAWYNGAWYVEAYCRLRQGNRNFRLNRMDDMRILDERFTPRHVPHPASRRITARVRVSHTAARWVRERQHYGFTGEIEDADGVVMTFEVDALDELKSWILMWGAQVEPLDPPALRVLIRDEVERMSRILT